MHILICGASIAGPALAHWLDKFGFEVTVVEQAPSLRPGGQAISIRGVAKEVVRRMDLDEKIRAARSESIGMAYVTKNNRRVASLNSSMYGGDGLVAEIEILRGDLAEVFYAATRSTAEYLFGDHLVALTEDADGVLVRFASGTERRFDLVVGADGLHSGLRKLVFEPASDTLHHLGHYLSFFTVPNSLEFDGWMRIYGEPGRWAGVRPIHDNRDVMGFFSFRSDPLDYDYRDTEQQKRILCERMAGMAWKAPWLLDQLDTSPDFYFDSCAQIRLDSWSKGRVALLGDAAFCPSPLSGQGTNLAIVGAYVLAGELATHRGSHQTAFTEYERKLREYVHGNQKLGQETARTFDLTSQLGIALRYTAVLAMAHLPGSSLIMRRMMHAMNNFELPDYPIPGPISS